MSNWKKVLFEGGNFDVRAITASQIPELTADGAGDTAVFNSTFKVISGLTGSDFATNPEFRFSQIDQNNLNTLQGTTQFTIRGKNIVPGVSQPVNAAITSTVFDAATSANNIINFRTVNSSVFTVDFSTDVAASPHTASVGINFVDGFQTGSEQFGLVSASVGVVANEIDHNAALLHVVTNPNNFAKDWIATVFPIIQNTSVNRHGSRLLVSQSKPDFTNPNSLHNKPHTTPALNDGIQTFSTVGTAGGSLNSSIDARSTLTWLSASFVGGFPQGSVTSSLTSSLTLLSGSISHFTGTIDPVVTSTSASNAITSSLATGDIGGFLPRENVTVKQVEDPLVPGTFRKQFNLTNLDTLERPQGLKIGLGEDYTTDPFTGGADGKNDLLIIGELQGNSLTLGDGGFRIRQTNIATQPSAITFGITSSLHTHSFFGDVFLSSSATQTPGVIGLSGSIEILNTLPSTDDLGVLNGQSGETKHHGLEILTFKNKAIVESLVSGSGALAASISGSALTRSASIATVINTLQTNFTTANVNALAVTKLEAGYNTNTNSLVNEFAKGIYFGTSSTFNNFNVSNVINGNSSSMAPKHTSSFEVVTTNDGVGTDGQTVISFSVGALNDGIPLTSGSAITLHFDTGSFITATNIFTSSTDVSNSVDDLNRYVPDTEGVFTGSNAGAGVSFVDAYTTNDKENIAKTATGLASATSTTRFITGAGSFNDLDDTPALGNLVDDTDSTSQGAIQFTLNDVFKFGATGSEMGPNGNPSFTSLTLNGDISVLGNVIEKQQVNLNIEDQFILVNSGALTPAGGFTSNTNDKDGGLLVAHDQDSGSLFMYDASQEIWGFKGGIYNGDTLLGQDVSSNSNIEIVPNVKVRVVNEQEINFNNTHPTLVPTYGASENARVGQFLVSSHENDDGNLFIYTG